MCDRHIEVCEWRMEILTCVSRNNKKQLEYLANEQASVRWAVAATGACTHGHIRASE